MAARRPRNNAGKDESRSPQDRSVLVARTPVGKGVFARRRYAATAIIGEIEGTYFDPSYGSDYCMTVSGDRRLEPSPPFRYVNHSCDPNCEFDWFQVREGAASRERVFLIALRDIRPGEELTIDYNWPAAGAIPCRCQSTNCRGWIVDPAQLDELLEQIAEKVAEAESSA
ncbi:MAG: SET domain-containing protein-lysine N-methyltransferase [Pirellulaceae bacterium]